jgi:hypothetical protein
MDEIDKRSFLFSVLLENGEKHKILACALRPALGQRSPFLLDYCSIAQYMWDFRAETVDTEEA